MMRRKMPEQSNEALNEGVMEALGLDVFSPDCPACGIMHDNCACPEPNEFNPATVETDALWALEQLCVANNIGVTLRIPIYQRLRMLKARILSGTAKLSWIITHDESIRFEGPLTIIICLFIVEWDNQRKARHKR